MMEGKESAKTDVNAFNMKKECPVCLNEFLPADSRLKLLTCTHEICVGCVKKIDKCPICKETLTVVDFENAEFVFRRGFNCHTCETRRTSEKMRICVTCSEANGVMVKPDKLKQCSPFIFCSECVIDDHMEQGHRQEKLMNYDLDHVSIKEMQRTCLTMRPLLERISSGMEGRARNYWKMTEAIKLVLSPDVDLHFSQLHSVCSFFREFLDTLSGDSDFQRKYATIWKELSNVLDEETSKKIAGEGEELFMKQRDFKEKIRLQQEEINELQSHLKERTEREKELRQEFEAKFLSQREDIGKLQSDLSTEKQLTQQTRINSPENVVRLPKTSTEMCTITPSSIHSIYISVNKPMYLCRLGMFATKEKTDVEASFRITGPNNLDVTESRVVPFHPASGTSVAQEVAIKKPLQLDPGCKYLFDLKVDKEVCVRQGYGGQSKMELSGYPSYEVEFSDCEGSETTIEKGQIRNFYFAPIR